MCLISFDWQPRGEIRLRLIANRDEFYQRPSAPLAWWADQPDVLAGRDLRGGGTWLGYHRSGRLAAVTNVREPGASSQGLRSRGELVSAFLTSDLSPEVFANRLQPQANAYAGFNLLLFDAEQAVYCSNRRPEPLCLSAGVYGLSNAALNTPWPKLLASCEVMRAGGTWPELQRVMEQTKPYPVDQLPDTGVGLEREQLLSSAFIVSADYGTRVISEVEWSSREVRLQERQFVQGQWCETRQESVPLGR